MVVDIETRSATDLTSCGVYKYVEDPDFDILLVGYCTNDEPVHVFDLHQLAQTGELGEWKGVMLSTLLDPDVLKVAHNAAFERTCFARYFGVPMPPEQWMDTQVMAANCGLPLSLDAATKALGFGEDTAKDARGKALIKLFSCPHKPTKALPKVWVMPEDEPEKWDTYVEYNAQDVVAERALFKTLLPWAPDETERRFWCLDQQINDRGIRIDKTLCENAQAIGRAYKAELFDRAVAITGLENPQSVAQVKDWLSIQEGITVPSLNKKVVADVVAQLTTDRAKEFMDVRSELSKSADKKYDAMLRSLTEDEHVKGCFQFFGGHTGRFAGRLVQLQNLKKNDMSDLAEARALVRTGDLPTVEALYGNVSDTLGQLVRTALIPEPGQRFIVSDFSAIEARVTAWFAQEQWRLDVFENGGDIYCESASQMFKVPVVKHGVNGELRQKGKIAELALGYGGGVNALKAFGADKMGLSEEDMAEIVDKWRDASPRVCGLWKGLERAAIRCVAKQQSTRDPVSGTIFDWERNVLWMRLPSGRRMAYYGAAYDESKLHPGRKTLSYMAQEQTSRKWMRTETWGGKMVENLVQATARDVLRDKMLAMSEAGFDIRAHVHDEVIITAPMDRTLEEVNTFMGAPIEWAPGLPLDADGYYCEWYRKD